MDGAPHLVTTAQAAEILGKPIGTVNRWVIEGRLPTAAQLPGRTGARLYRRADVEALAKSVAA